MKTLIILNEPAYGNERSYNGLRLAGSLAKTGETELRVEESLTEGARRSTMAELTEWTLWADKVLTF